MNTEFIDDFSKEIFDQTYAYNNNETISEAHYRIANNLASVESKYKNSKGSEYWATRFNKLLKNFAFVPGGRIISNAGTGLLGTTYINCFVDGFTGHDKDSMNGIMDALKRQAMILKSEGGYGFCADVMRPRGCYINGIGNDSPGAVKMLDMWDKQSEVITAGSGKKITRKKGKTKIRKGAQMVTMSIWHPDIKEFIKAKQTPGRLSKFNMSCLISDAFMEAVKYNKPWNLEFPDIDNDIEEYKTSWDGNLDKWKKSGNKTVIYKTFDNANELWDVIMKSTYTRNEPGVLFVDTINRLNNLYYTEYINSTNPCVTSDTLVETNLGKFTVKELVDNFKSGHKYKAKSYNINNNKVEFKDILNAQKTKKLANIIKITLDSGKTLKLTPDHKVYTENRGYVKAADLNENDIILESCD